MVTFPMSYPRGKMSLLPWTREDVRAMLTRTPVIITAILCGTVLLMSFVAALTLLAFYGRGTEVLTVTLVVPVVALLVAVLRRMARLDEKTAVIDEKASQIQVQTNGTTTTLVKAAIASPAVSPEVLS